jgi:uncharacterized protein (TIGR03086 family)
MSEVVQRYQGLAQQFGARVEATDDDQWTAPAPCDGWTARDVVKHVIEGQKSVITTMTDAPPRPMADDDDPKQAWRTSNDAMSDALAQPGALEKKVKSPMGEMPAELIVGRILSMEVLVHAWDLARATGGDEHLDQDAVAHTLEGIRPVGPMLRASGMFGPEVEAPEGADVQTQLLCFLGRRP